MSDVASSMSDGSSDSHADDEEGSGEEGEDDSMDTSSDNQGSLPPPTASSRSAKMSRARCTPEAELTLLILELQLAKERPHPFELSLRDRLTCPVAFLPKLEATLQQHGVALVDVTFADHLEFLVQLSPKISENDPLADSLGWLMHFGCVNNNGHQGKSSAASSSSASVAAASVGENGDGLVREHPPAPTFEDKIRHIEADNAAIFDAPTSHRADPPESMRNRRYFKDVSQTGGWRAHAKADVEAATAAPGAGVPDSDAGAAAAAAPAAAAPTKKKEFFPKLDKMLQAVFGLWPKPTDAIDQQQDADAEAFSDVDDEADEQHKQHARRLRQFFKKLEDGGYELPTGDGEVRAASVATVTTRGKKGQAAKARAKQRPRGDRTVFIHPLYLNELQLHRRSLVSLSFVDFDGVKKYYLYLKLGFQFFNLHIEQMIFSFIHHQLRGESVWFLIPFSQLDKLYQLAAKVYCKIYHVDWATLSAQHRTTAGKLLVYGKQWWPAPSSLKQAGITFHTVRLKAGQILTADGDYAHFGFSSGAGETISVAANTATDRWLERGLPFLIGFFSWVGELKKFVALQAQPNQPPQPSEPSIHKLKSLRDLAAKSLNLCPSNFACSFMRGLRADLKRLASEQGNGQGALCDYPNLTRPDPMNPEGEKVVDQELALKYANQCKQIIQLIHQHRTYLKEMDESNNQCPACFPPPEVAGKKKPAQPGHTCMYCLCSLGAEESNHSNSSDSERTESCAYASGSSAASAAASSSRSRRQTAN